MPFPIDQDRVLYEYDMQQQRSPVRYVQGLHMERAKRFELSTSTLARLHSTTELYPHFYFLGASGRNRTTDTRIFSPLLYRLSYRGIWRRRWGSNPRPPAWQAGILTNWTTAPHWWAMTGSNCRHLACKASALPAELITRTVSNIKKYTTETVVCQWIPWNFSSFYKIKNQYVSENNSDYLKKACKYGQITG